MLYNFQQTTKYMIILYLHFTNIEIEYYDLFDPISLSPPSILVYYTKVQPVCPQAVSKVFYVDWSTLCRLVKFYMSTGQLYVVWSTLCHLVKFYMSSGQLYVVRSSLSAPPSQYEVGSESSAFRGTYRE